MKTEESNGDDFQSGVFNFYQEIISANVTDISLVLPDQRLSSITGRAAFYHPTYSNALLLPTHDFASIFSFFDELVFTSS